MKPAIIFRGKGNVPTEERLKHDKDVDVSPCTSASSPGKNRREREVCVMPTLIVFYTAGGFPGMSGENF